MNSTAAAPDLVYHDPRQPPFALGGFAFFDTDQSFFRLPEAIRAQLRPPLAWVAAQPSGGLIRFCTNSRRLAVRVKLGRQERFSTNPLLAESGFDVYVGPGNQTRFVQTLCPETVAPAYDAALKRPLPEGEHEVSCYFPILNPVEKVEIGLDPGASISLPPPRKIGRPVAFYGSSITQGFCASRSGLTYPARLCRALDAELLNFGFGGNAQGDPDVARAIAGLDLAAFVYDYDHNAPSLEHLARTHEPFFQQIRAAHPDLPIIVLSSPNWHADPAYFEQRAAVIRQTCESARAAGDRNVWYLPGKALYPEPWEDATVDRLHPNDAGFEAMARKLLPQLRAVLGA